MVEHVSLKLVIEGGGVHYVITRADRYRVYVGRVDQSPDEVVLQGARYDVPHWNLHEVLDRVINVLPIHFAADLP